MTAALATAEAIAAVVDASLVALVERTRVTPSAHPTHLYASAARECERRMYYEATAPEAQAPHSTELLAKFSRGRDRERDWSATLIRAGRDADPPFRVVEQERRVELRDRKGRIAITGRVDLHLQFDGGVLVPVEIKAWSPLLTDRLRSFDDVYDSPWTRSGGQQVLAYLYGTSQPFGLLFLDRPGLPRLLPIVLEHHLDRVEHFLSQAERVLDAIERGTPPPFLVGNAAECQRCPFYGGTCDPPLDHSGAIVLTDPELEALLDRREALRAAGEEYDRIDRDVKARLRGTEMAFAGPFAISGKWSKSSRVDLPEDLRRQYTKTEERGRFTLTITKLTETAPEVQP